MKKILTFLFIFALIFTLTIPTITIADPGNGQGNAYGHNNPSNPHYQGGQPGNSGGNGGNSGGNGNGNGNGNGGGNGGGNPPPGPGGNPGHGSTNVTNNYYSSTEYSGTYNDTDVQQTYEYDINNEYTYDYSNNTENNDYAYSYSYSYSPVTNNYIDNSEVLKAISTIHDDHLHEYVMDSASATLGIGLTKNYQGVVYGPASKPIPDAKLQTSAIVSLNPAKLPMQLGPGEFSKFVIAVTADQPIKLRVTGSKGNVKVLVKEIEISEPGAVAYVPVIYTFKKGSYWSYGKVLFTNVYGEIMAKTEITCDNIYALDWVSSLTTDSRYTSIGHGFRVNRGSYGLSAFVGIKHDREENDSEVYGTVNIDW